MPRNRKHFDETGKVIPDPEDFDAVERKYGPTPPAATVEQRAKMYQMARANKLIRLWQQGKLPLEETDPVDKIAHDSKPGKRRQPR
jgi:hypothetical protein